MLMFFKYPQGFRILLTTSPVARLHRYRRRKNRLLKFMCLLLVQLKIGFFSSFSDAAVYSTNEASKAGLKQSIIFRCLC